MDKAQLDKIMNMNPLPDLMIIDQSIADRQAKVILKGYNHLAKENENLLYIADEVGMGKTYEAIGIATLFRHFASEPDKFHAVFIVPNKHLQAKWEKDLHAFHSYNFIPKLPPWSIEENIRKYERLEHFDHQKTFSIFRNYSFSLGACYEFGAWQPLLDRIANEEHKRIFEDVCSYYDQKGHPEKCKYALAYILNLSLPEIDLLMVDEAHIFKHGFHHTALRNQLITRFMGLTHEEDEDMLNNFPELKKLIKPKVKKLILMSATPIDKGLYEIKYETDCFLHNIPYSDWTGTDINKHIERDIPYFLIRGLMTTKYNGKDYSRFNYRHEHRKGNVEKTETAVRQTISNNQTAIFMSMLQYKLIKHLDMAHGRKFEMGMLAGFETFNLDVSNCRNSENHDNEYEGDTITNNRHNKSVDSDVINQLIESYKETLNCNYPPHPKQDSLVKEICKNMLEGRKSLIFVRRIASSFELERKIMNEFNSVHIKAIRSVKKLMDVKLIQDMVNAYTHTHLSQQIESVIQKIVDKLTNDTPKEYQAPDDIYDRLKDMSLEEEFQKLLISINKNGLTDYRFKKVLKKIEENREQESFDESTQETDDSEREETLKDKENTSDFFIQYFNGKGASIKRDIYRKDWLELDICTINNEYKLFHINTPVEPVKRKRNEPKRAFFIRKQESLQINEIGSFNKPCKGIETFLTRLLIKECSEEFSTWISEHKASKEEFLNHIALLNSILRSLFRQGSGRLPLLLHAAYKKEKKNSDINFLIKLLKDKFEICLNQIKEILTDYDRIMKSEFSTLSPKAVQRKLMGAHAIFAINGWIKEDRNRIALQFRMPGYPLTLITTDIMKEGVDLHTYCSDIYHYGIAWNPSDMEQRSGRIDRINSLTSRRLLQSTHQSNQIPFDHKLQIFYPYLSDTLEINQMKKLFIGMDDFTRMFYNDISCVQEKDQYTSTDEKVEESDIFEYSEKQMESKYDVDNFMG